MKCHFCQQPLKKDISFSDLLGFHPILFNECCLSCYEELVCLKKGNRCRYCGKNEEGIKDICKDCVMWRKQFPDFCLHHDYLYPYSEKMSDYFKEFKFLGDKEKGKVFAKDVYQSLYGFQSKGYLIVPIPLSKAGLRSRGFNQVEELLKQSHITYSCLLSKKDTTTKQTERMKEERILTKQPFFVHRNKSKKIEKNKIMLVDDVYTTGRTLLHAYQCLLRFNPKEIGSFSLSR